ncbi:hypothetical protein AB1J03_09700 [Vibrio diabolicus]|uniref:hypothetical protein n=1 Tax=Vibrio diabolicus TaxID=50719 RepID=UPI0034587E17
MPFDASRIYHKIRYALCDITYMLFLFFRENHNQMKDVIIPIVFPDYKIAVATPRAVEVPDLIPFIDILPNNIQVPHTKAKMSNLGHAGVLFINGSNGVTKYYEYGRYDPKGNGWVKKIRNLPDVKIDPKGSITKESLTKVLSVISIKAGQRGNISAAYIEVENKYSEILDFSINRMRKNHVPDRKEYGLFTYSCLHFMKGALEAAGVETPTLIDPRPVSYIEELQEDYRVLEYVTSTNNYTLGK